MNNQKYFLFSFCNNFKNLNGNEGSGSARNNEFEHQYLAHNDPDPKLVCSTVSFKIIFVKVLIIKVKAKFLGFFSVFRLLSPFGRSRELRIRNNSIIQSESGP